MRRVAEDLLGGAHLDDAPAAQDQRLVGDVVAEREVVRDEEDPDAALLQVAEQVEHVDPGRRVEHADDLVGDEELELEEQRAGDHQALQLSAAQLVRVLAEHVGRLERDRLERLPQLRLPVARAQPGEVARPDHAEHAIDLEDGVVRAERVLEDALDVSVVVAELAAAEARDVATVERDRAGRRLGQPQDHPADGRLAAAALADQGDDLTRLRR